MAARTQPYHRQSLFFFFLEWCGQQAHAQCSRQPEMAHLQPEHKNVLDALGEGHEAALHGDESRYIPQRVDAQKGLAKGESILCY